MPTTDTSKRKGRPLSADPVSPETAEPGSGWVGRKYIESEDDFLRAPADARENPGLLGGVALRILGHRRGIPRSELDVMSDEKIREQLRYLAQNRYEMG